MSEVNISATAVKELREQTGVGMMDCKKALGRGRMVISTKPSNY
jgi:translation elongation factor EF-Ts